MVSPQRPSALSQRLAAVLVDRLRGQRGLDASPKDLALERLGTNYGGWVVPSALITQSWICYCGGVGEDASFDLELIRRFGCEVFAFDPTPRAIRFAEPIRELEPRFHFEPIGLWSTDSVQRFYAPANPSHVSHSLLNLQGTAEFFDAPCRTIESLMRSFGHGSINLLKLDVEGAEHTVLVSLFATSTRPLVLCFEVDRPVGILQLVGTLWRVARAGYRRVSVDGWNFTFVHRDAAT